MSDKHTDMTVAKTILEQLGGNKFMAMTGVKKFSMDETGGISFKLGRNGSKCNHVSIEYDYGKDLYNVVFGKNGKTKNKELSSEGFTFWDYNYKELERTNGCYFDMLVPMFERYTGLATKLF